jgi:hypothetical protein
MWNWENRPVVFLLMATVVILVGTVFTMVLPFAWVNTERDRIDLEEYRAALKKDEGKPTIPWETLKQELGL